MVETSQVAREDWTMWFLSIRLTKESGTESRVYVGHCSSRGEAVDMLRRLLMHYGSKIESSVMGPTPEYVGVTASWGAEYHRLEAEMRNARNRGHDMDISLIDG